MWGGIRYYSIVDVEKGVRHVVLGRYPFQTGFDRHCHVCIAVFFFFFQAEDGIRDKLVTGVQTCALPISILGFSNSAPRRSATAAPRLDSEAEASRNRYMMRSPTSRSERARFDFPWIRTRSSKISTVNVTCTATAYGPLA